MDFRLTTTDLHALLPLVILSAGACLVLLIDLFLREEARSRVLPPLTSLILLGALGAGIEQYISLSPGSFRFPSERLGPLLTPIWRHQVFTAVGAILLCGIALAVHWISTSWLREEDRPAYGEYQCLLLLFPIGTILLIGARNLMLAFVGLEIFSVALYVLTAMRRTRSRAVEAGLKYFLLGAFAAAIFLYGSALIYAGKGTLDLPDLGAISREGLPAPVGLAALGGGILFLALFFKASVAPFHMWTPDVYQGAPTPITALMSTGTKTAAFFLLITAARLFPHEILPLIPILAIVSILVGNAGALRQTDLKRLLAYSGVAHAGYLLVAYCAIALGQGHQDAHTAIRAILYYLAVYGITNLAAFGVLAWLERREESVLTFEGIRGLGRRNPFCAAVLALAALSLAGIPPTAGFWAKYQVFAAALSAGQTTAAVVGILGSVVGLYYYLRILVALYFEPAPEEARIPAAGFAGALTLGLSGAAILLFGIFPSLLVDPLIHIRL